MTELFKPGRSPARFIAAIDPGMMTGVALWDCSIIRQPHTMQLDVEEFFLWVKDELVDGWTQYDIVCEAFIISQRTLKVTSQTWSLEHIGLLKWAGWLRHHRFTLQQASAAKKFCTDDRLKEYGWWTPGQGHANDALRHMMLYALNERIITL